MSMEILTGAFRIPRPQDPSNANPLNLDDTVLQQGDLTPSRSPGATLIDPITLAPTLNQTWTLLAWSVQLALRLNVYGTQNSPSYGRPGKLFAALMRSGSPTQGVAAGAQQLPWQNTYQPPADFTNVLAIWDGGSDPPPDQSGSGTSTGGSLFSIADNLPSPIKLVAGGSTPLVGLFLTPSIGSAYGLTVMNGIYSVTYETE